MNKLGGAVLLFFRSKYLGSSSCQRMVAYICKLHIYHYRDHSILEMLILHDAVNTPLLSTYLSVVYPDFKIDHKQYGTLLMDV